MDDSPRLNTIIIKPGVSAEVALWLTHYWPIGRPSHGRPLGGLNRARCGVPRDRTLTEVRFVGHVARERGIVSKHGVFCNLLVVLDTLEISPKMRLFVIPGITAIRIAFQDRLLPRHRIVLRMPIRHIRITPFL